MTDSEDITHTIAPLSIMVGTKATTHTTGSCRSLDTNAVAVAAPAAAAAAAGQHQPGWAGSTRPGSAQQLRLPTHSLSTPILSLELQRRRSQRSDTIAIAAPATAAAAAGIPTPMPSPGSGGAAAGQRQPQRTTAPRRGEFLSQRNNLGVEFFFSPLGRREKRLEIKTRPFEQ